ncbi:MAG: PorV/PorQ family protein [Candidatus Marinimicrobia bacterium]|nr:PorV/PorQ family protein [Candidatus Neomarinimicrobiota bacterium]
MKKLIGILFILTALMNSSLYSAQTKVATTAAQFLGIGQGARALATGGAFSAVANDPSALYWNVAGVANLEKNGILFSHTKWFADISHQYFALVYQLGYVGTVGLSATYLNYGTMERTTIEHQEGDGTKFESYDFVLNLHFARQMSDKFSIGGTVKYITQKIDIQQASGVAFDLGTLYKLDFRDTQIGMSFSNFGTKMQMEGKGLYVNHDIDESYDSNPEVNAVLLTDKFNLPIFFRAGVSMTAFERDPFKITIAADALYPNDNSASLNLGAEFSFLERFYLRGGYKDLGLKDSESGLTFGGGVRLFYGTRGEILIDYAYQTMEYLSSPQYFSIVLYF